MSVPRQLISYLNSGKCFALVGSGPSSGMGYPTWKALGDQGVALGKSKGIPKHEEDALKGLMDKWDFPEVFQRVAQRLGGVANLVSGLKPTFKGNQDTGRAYEYLAKWPFRCYLTTNYDDELVRHLSRVGEHFTTIKNSKADLAQITGDASKLVAKIHGDLDTPNDIVLTTSQYTQFETGGERQYFRNKLASIFQLLPVVIVGHSMSDRDLRLILQCAAESVSPDKPTYVIVADASPADVDKFRREFNIHLLSYKNDDGRHSNLIHLLRQIDRFVIPRTNKPAPPLDFPDLTEVAAGVSLYVHSALGFGGQSKLIQRALQPQILNQLSGRSPAPVTFRDLAATLQPERLRTEAGIATEVQTAVQHLVAKNYAAASADNAAITPHGRDHLAEVKRKREVEEDQVYGAIRAKLAKHGTPAEVDQLVGLLKQSIQNVFRRRGLATAELLFRENPYQPPDMPEVFAAVFPPASTVESYALRAEYCDAVMDLLTQPTPEQRRYLANIAQGFFAYHMFGLDPSGQEVRRRLEKETFWLLDSNILMPMVALGCQFQELMASLVRRIVTIGIKPYTTLSFIGEVDKSLKWAKSNVFSGPEAGERERILQLIKRPDYSTNPFIDGFIRGASGRRWRSFVEYIATIKLDRPGGIEAAVAEAGVAVIDTAAVLAGKHANDIKPLSEAILKERTRLGTLRAGVPQADAEAEALALIRHIRVNGLPDRPDVHRAYFVSTSSLLDRMYQDHDGLLTWFPETLNKHLEFISGGPIDTNSVYDSLATGYYSTGISIIDDQAYLDYFRPAVTESGIVLKREIDGFVKSLSDHVEHQQRDKESLLAKYDATPLLDRPDFVAQLGWRAARHAQRRAEIAEQAKLEAEKAGAEKLRALQAEMERKARERQRTEEGRLRNLADPKHQRKLLRQKKKKKRKGK